MWALLDISSCSCVHASSKWPNLDSNLVVYLKNTDLYMCAGTLGVQKRALVDLDLELEAAELPCENAGN